MSDYSDVFDQVEEAQASSPSIAVLQAAVIEAKGLEDALSQMEEDQKALRKQLHHIRTSRIPDLMAECGLEEFKTANVKVKMQDFASGSIPKDPEKRQAAIKALTEYGGESLIKTQVSLDFGKSQHNEAMNLAGKLEEDGYAVSVSSGVHASSLCAFVREKIRNGDDIDAEVLGVFVGKVAKISEVKEG